MVYSLIALLFSIMPGFNNIIILFLIGILGPCLCVAQELDTLYVSHDKTTYVLLPDEIEMVDIGHKEFLFNKSNNMVLFKALRPGASTTSLMIKSKTSVIVWIIAYKQNPRKLLIDTRSTPLRTESQATTSTTPTLSNNSDRGSGQPIHQTSVQQRPVAGYESADAYRQRMETKYSQVALHPIVEKRTASGNRDALVQDAMMQQKLYFMLGQPKVYKDIGEITELYFSLHDVFVDRNHMYFKLGIHNLSSISFDLDFISFEHSQGRTMKRREATGKRMLGVVNRESVYSIAPDTEEIVIYVLDLFALQDKDTIQVKLSELGGVRTLRLSIPAKVITQAKTL